MISSKVVKVMTIFYTMALFIPAMPEPIHMEIVFSIRVVFPSGKW